MSLIHDTDTLVQIQYAGTCEGCLMFRRAIMLLTASGEITATAQIAFNLMHISHHIRNMTISRRDYFRRMMEHDMALSHRHYIRQMYYDLALPVLAGGIAKPTILSTAQPKYALGMDKLLGLTGGRCLCGCGQIIKQRRMFISGHDTKLLSLLKQVERGEIFITDVRIPEHLRLAAAQLPRCTCCGHPIIRGVRVSGGWMGAWCASGTCTCRARDQARIAKANN